MTRRWKAPGDPPDRQREEAGPRSRAPGGRCRARPCRCGGRAPAPAASPVTDPTGAPLRVALREACATSAFPPARPAPRSRLPARYSPSPAAPSLASRCPDFAACCPLLTLPSRDRPAAWEIFSRGQPPPAAQSPGPSTKPCHCIRKGSVAQPRRGTLRPGHRHQGRISSHPYVATNWVDDRSLPELYCVHLLS